VNAILEEKLRLEVHREGQLQKLELEGTLKLQALEPQRACLQVHLDLPEDSGLVYKIHPQLDKSLFARCILGHKQRNKPFPPSELTVLRYRLQQPTTWVPPFSVNCWPSLEADNTCSLSVEYELEDPQLTLKHVVISIPCPTPPDAGDMDGNYSYDERNGKLVWTVNHVDSTNRTGSAEFSLHETDTGSLYPVDVHFHCSQALSGVKIAKIVTTDEKEVAFSLTTRFECESFQIV
jgi:hypothetical protein